MGRRSLTCGTGRRAVCRHTDTDHARIEAQRHEIKMVRYLANTVYDPLVKDLELKRKAANDVLHRARGQPGIRMETAPAQMPKVAVDPAVVRAAMDRHRELSKWVGVVPVQQWPPHVHEMLAEQNAMLAGMGLSG